MVEYVEKTLILGPRWFTKSNGYAPFRFNFGELGLRLFKYTELNHVDMDMFTNNLFGFSVNHKIT